jgi:hypothetical protein
MPMAYTTFNELVERKAEDKFGGNFQITGFYQGSVTDARLGKYFGVNNKSSLTLKNNAQTNGGTAAGATSADLDLAYILHDFGNTAYVNQTATISLNPTSNSYGARFDYYQDLEKILKGLYLSVALPVVHIDNDLGMKFSGANTAGGSVTVASALSSYFAGNYTAPTGDTSGQNAQSGLTKAKYQGRQGATGVADIEVKLGYKFLHKENYHVGLNIGLTIPTGNTAKGTYALEPIYGNGQHFAFGGGLDTRFKVWGEEDHYITLGFDLDYRYLFQSSETRTPGLCSNVGSLANWGQYYLLGQAKGSNAIGVTLTPAANLIAQSCNVTPGSQLEGIANFSYNNGGFTWDLGYNIYWREAESVSAKGSGLTPNTYGIAARSVNAADGSVNSGAGTATPTATFSVPAWTAGAASSSSYSAGPISATSSNGTVFGLSNAYNENTTPLGPSYFGASTAQFDSPGSAAAASSLWLSQGDSYFSQAQSASICTHKIYTGLGYTFKEWDTPLMLGLNGSYEFGDNNVPDYWMVGGKIGVAF